MSETFVIIGAGLAGATAAFTLRDEGFDGRIVLIGEEQQPPYERPPLSKGYLRGEKTLEEFQVRPLAHYTEKQIESCFGVKASRIDPQAKMVELANSDVVGYNQRISYDKVLIATGCRNRKLPIPGIDLQGIYDLRDVSNADFIRGECIPGRKAVIVGMGWIGSEVAASLRQLGLDVTVVERLPLPLPPNLGEAIGRLFVDIHREHGVQMYFDDGVMGFDGDGRVQRVVTNSGRQLDCDFAIVGIGVEPVTDVVAGSGVKVENGIVVDQYCQTNIPGIYAVGDVANHYHPLVGKQMRVEHYQNAISHGIAAAQNMLGSQQPYEEVHWFWSDQYEYNIQYGGFHGEWDEFVLRGSLEARDFLGFYLRDGRIQAVIGMNRNKDLRLAMRLIAAQITLNTNELADESVKIRALLPK